MLLRVEVGHVDQPSVRWVCRLLGFGSILCGRCDGELDAQSETDVVATRTKCKRCGAVVTFCSSNSIQASTAGETVGQRAARLGETVAPEQPDLADAPE